MRKMLRWLGLLFLLLLVVLGGIFVIAQQNSATFSNAALADPLALWNAHALQNYRLSLDMTALPLPNIELELLVRDEVIANTQFPACEETSEQFSTQRCELAEAYYRTGHSYTVTQLFELAESCTENTRQALSTCSLSAAVQSNGFSSFEELQATLATNCPADFHPTRFLCAVEYDSIWGYPKAIWHYWPGVDDGYGYIRVTDFEPLDL